MELWEHDALPNLKIYPASFQDLQYIREKFPDSTNPLEQVRSVWETGDDPNLGTGVGFPMWPGLLNANPFDINIDPWIGTFSLYAWGRGASGVAHPVPAFVVQASFYASRLRNWTTGPLPPGITDWTLGVVESLWTDRARAANEALQARFNRWLSTR